MSGLKYIDRRMTFLQKILDILTVGIKEKGHASLVVSGGTSLISVFKGLSESDLDWERVSITLVDNRIVPKESLDNNEHLIKTKLLIKNAEKAKFISLDESSMGVFQKLLPFNLVLLGMGEDGHFASIFPDMVGDKRFLDSNEPPNIFKVSKRGIPCVPRITMNLSLIMKSKNIILAVSNYKKRDILRDAKTNKSYPLYWLLNQEKTPVEIVME